MPDIIRKELMGVACNKQGQDTRKFHWYVLDEDPISDANCRFWQMQAGFDPEIYGCYHIVIRKRKRGGYQATWNCAYDSLKAKAKAAADAVSVKAGGERRFKKRGQGHRGDTIYIDHLNRFKKYKIKSKLKSNTVEETKPKKQTLFGTIKDFSLKSFWVK